MLTISSSTPDSASVTTTSAVALAANSQRRGAVLVNIGAADVYLNIGATAVAGKGICLKANGGAYEINSANLTLAAIHAVTSSGTSTLSTADAV